MSQRFRLRMVLEVETAFSEALLCRPELFALNVLSSLYFHVIFRLKKSSKCYMIFYAVVGGLPSCHHRIFNMHALSAESL